MPPKAPPAPGAKPQQAANPVDALALTTSASQLDETAVRQSAVVSATFANVELQTTRQTLKQYVQLFEESRDENQRLASELVERDKDSMKVVQFLRAELDAKLAEMAQVQQQHKVAVDKIRADFHVERKQLLGEINEREDEISSLQNQLSVVQGDLEALQQFASDRDRLHEEMTSFREQHNRECEAYEKEISRLRFTSLEEKVRVKAEERILTEKFEAEVSDRAMKLLDAKTKEIHNENFALLEDKVLLEQELDRLVADNKRMKDMTGSQRRDVELAKIADEEYSKRGARQGREIKDLRNQCKLMETNIAKLIDEYEHKLEVQTHKFQTETEKLKEERDLSYRNAENRHKELARMRQLSKHIVRQRSDLEMFFNEALEYVRQQIVIERHQVIQEKFAPANGQRAIASQEQPPRLLMSEQGSRGGQPPLPPPPHQQPPAASSDGGARPVTDQQRGNSALIPSHHPFFQGTGKEFDSIYHAADEALPSHRSSAHLPRVPSSNNSSTLPVIHSRGQGGPLPAIQYGKGASTVKRNGGGATGNGSADPFTGTTDIAHLSWADKERVLRILLAKINNAARYERKDHTDLIAGKHPQQIMQVVAPSAPKQITAVSDTFLTQSTE